MATTTGPTYSAAGLASNLDWTPLIDSMIKLQQQPLNALKQQQAALNTQISALASIASKLSSLDSAANDLSTSGVLGVQVRSANTTFTATPGPGAMSGSFSLKVNELATVAKARSDKFADKNSEVRSGTLDLTVMGKPYTVTLAAGGSLADAAAAINASGAPVMATVLDNGSGAYLSLTNRDTGFPLDKTSADALAIVEHSDAGTAPPLNLAITQAPTNASFTLDGLDFTRTSNVVTDAITGVALTLKSKTTVAEDLILDNDATGTQSRLQDFVDAYNGVLALVQKQLNVAAGTDRSTSLAGDSNVRNLQGRMQAILTSRVGAGTVRSLADLGVKTARDGSLSIDSAALTAAIARDPASVDKLFSTATTGIAAQMKSLVKAYTDPINGQLTQRTSSIQRQIKNLDDSATKLQLRIDETRKTLIARFSAMESVISGLKATGQYLDSQANAAKGSNS